MSLRAVRQFLRRKNALFTLRLNQPCCHGEESLLPVNKLVTTLMLSGTLDATQENIFAYDESA